MIHLEERNQKIIDAIIEKASIVCPGSVALIGIYGSFVTGDIHEKSDLDLLILINDDRGWQLGCGMIQDDLQVGHDIYCTTWESLQYDAGYVHPNISKLMDARIVYCADEKYIEQLEALQQKVRDILAAPFSSEDYEKAEKVLKEAKDCYAMAMISDDLPMVFELAGGVVYYVENAIAMLNKQYFRQGVKRTYEEIAEMKKRPEQLCGLIENVISATSTASVKEHLTTLMKETMTVFQLEKEMILGQKKPVTADNINGTYEEMYSNWRSKMNLAAKTGNRHLAFMSLISNAAMFNGISGGVDIEQYNIMECYEPEDLLKTANAYDNILTEYLNEYKKAGLSVKQYADIDEFVLDYLKSQELE